MCGKLKSPSSCNFTVTMMALSIHQLHEILGYLWSKLSCLGDNFVLSTNTFSEVGGTIGIV